MTKTEQEKTFKELEKDRPDLYMRPIMSEFNSISVKVWKDKKFVGEFELDRTVSKLNTMIDETIKLYENTYWTEGGLGMLRDEIDNEELQIMIRRTNLERLVKIFIGMGGDMDDFI